MTAIDSTLNERGDRYGEFDSHAAITQTIKRAMQAGRRWADLDDDMREALEMIAHKMGRILNGDPEYVDSWHDIIGYARLVEQRLEKPEAIGVSQPITDQLARPTHDVRQFVMNGVNTLCDCQTGSDDSTPHA